MKLGKLYVNLQYATIHYLGGAVPLLRQPGAQLPLPAVCGGGAPQRGLQPRGDAAAQDLPSQARPQVLGGGGCGYNYKYQHEVVRYGDSAQWQYSHAGPGCDASALCHICVSTSNQNLVRGAGVKHVNRYILLIYKCYLLSTIVNCCKII